VSLLDKSIEPLVLANPPQFLEQTSPSVSELWSTARDSASSCSARLGAVQTLLELDPDAAVEFIVEELSRDDPADEWREAMVFLTEDIHLPSHLRHRAGDRLLTIAASLRGSTKVGAEKVVWSALRRAATLLLRDQADRLLCFLDCPSIVDTRSVALRCIERMFEPTPPRDGDLPTALSARAAELAFKFLDPDVFAGGENALIAQNAVCALAALDDDRLGEAIARVNQLGRPWLNRQVRTRLEELLESWRTYDAVSPDHPAFKKLPSARQLVRDQR
jgi:hypothetical protein